MVVNKKNNIGSKKMDIKEIWAQALVKLQSEVSTISYDLWIKSLEPIDFKNNIFYLSTTSETAKQSH